MTHAIASALAVAALFAVLAWLAVWSRRADRMRHLAIACFLGGLPLLAVAGVEILSWARPLWAMYDLPRETRVLAAKMIDGEAIYVWLEVGSGQPRAVALPWNSGQAKSLQDLFDDPKNGNQAILRYEWSWERRAPLAFYPPPQPPVLPPKQPDGEAVPHLEL